MKKESIITGIIGLLLGVIVTGFAAGQAVNNNNQGMMRMMGMHASDTKQQSVVNHDEMLMSEMAGQLTDKTGDDFDKAFIEMMIVHHEGAVTMAELIPSRAKHDEVKELGEAIITAQTKEIADMKQWQQDWGYSSDEMNQMMHGGH
jgi:uncharacterized protein (DUF305 family)